MSIDGIRVSFENFWPGFRPEDFFVPFIEMALSRQVFLSESSSADLVFRSVFAKRTLTRRALDKVSRKFGILPVHIENRSNTSQTMIWYSGENQRPPINGFDLTYSFDADPFNGSNVYLPLLLLGLDWFDSDFVKSGLEGTRAGKVVTPAIASMHRESDVAEREGFVCAFVGNAEPIRMRALSELERIGIVDIFGTSVGRPVPSKFEIARNYRFMLCFENDLYPGYVTEKPLEAWASGCIPLWRGIDSQGLLNPQSHVNSGSFSSLRMFVDFVSELNQDEGRLRRMGSEPLFLEQPTLKVATAALRQLFEIV